MLWKLFLVLTLAFIFAISARAQCANGNCPLSAQHPRPHAEIFPALHSGSPCSSICGTPANHPLLEALGEFVGAVLRAWIPLHPVQTLRERQPVRNFIANIRSDGMAQMQEGQPRTPVRNAVRRVLNR